MPHFGKKIRALREASHLSLDELAEKSGISRATIWNAEQAASPKMQGSTYRLLAQAFGMTTAELDAEWRASKIQQTKGGPGIPVINRAPAGEIVDYHECGVDSGQGHVYIDRGGILDPNAFAVIVTGDSMTPQLSDGDYAIFVPVDQDWKTHTGRVHVDEGETVFVRLSEEAPQNGCTIAAIYKLRDGRLELRKSNPKYTPRVVYPEHIARISVLVAIQRVVKKGISIERPGYEEGGVPKESSGH